MTYNMAKTIQSLVEQFDYTWDDRDFVCVIQKAYHDDECHSYKCCLGSRQGYTYRLVEFAGFVTSMSHLVNNFTYRFSEVNIGTSEDVWVKCIEVI